MRVFVTGATGFIGSTLVPELIKAGHQVLGLTRSDAGAQALVAAGAEPHRGDLHDLESLRRGAAQSDGVIHLAFIHDFSQFEESCKIDQRAVEAIGSVLAGSDRPFIVTSGLALAQTGPGQSASEDSPVVSSAVIPRAASEETARALAARGVNVSIVRLPQIHDTRKQGLVTRTIALARDKGVSAYIGDGSSRWSAAHVVDTAHLYRLALEKAERGAIYHSVAEEGVRMREIAEVIGRGLKVPVVSLSPEEAQAHFGWLAMFAGRDLAGSSVLTRKKLGWNPTGRGLIADLEQVQYSQA
jgi:nucleoside-diphosphate-sugar epimerase